jgi:AbrB family looped-hinge helix DNA binding protein
MFEVTKVGERGQVVIPQPFRKEMHIHKGEKFMVIRKDNTLIFKRLFSPSKKEIENMFKHATEHAKKHGLTEEDMWDAIKKARKK